jgi:transcription initiation factor IIE alpha subunit
MSLRSEVRRMLEEGHDEKRIVAELRCHPATVQKVIELMVFEKTIVSDKERERRDRVAALSLWDLQNMARPPASTQ